MEAQFACEFAFEFAFELRIRTHGSRPLGTPIYLDFMQERPANVLVARIVLEM